MKYIINEKDIFTYKNALEASKLIGEEGYFADSYEELSKELRKENIGRLRAVYSPEYNYTDMIFLAAFESEGNFDKNIPFGMFIPKNKVKEIEESSSGDQSINRPDENIYRPFKDCPEFVNVTGVFPGKVICLAKREGDLRGHFLVTGLNESDNLVSIDGTEFNFGELFYEYKYKNSATSDRWLTFGIPKEENE